MLVDDDEATDLEQQAQRLHRTIEEAERRGERPTQLHLAVAAIYERRARALLPDVEGWPDTFAAISHFKEGEDLRSAKATIEWAGEQAALLEDPEARASLAQELGELESWLSSSSPSR